MSETQKKRTQETWSAGLMQKKILEMAVQLRNLADTVERSASTLSRVGSIGRPNYGAVAIEVQQSLLHGMSQLRLDLVTMYATDADVARAKGE